MDKILGYNILRVHPASSGVIYFVERRGRKYVVKEFQTYRFSCAEGEKSIIPAKDKRSGELWRHMKRIYRYIRRHCRTDGLLNVPLRIVRKGKCMYKINYMVEGCGVPVEELSSTLTAEKMDVLVKSILQQMDMLAGMRFVHGDMKPENVMITLRNGWYVGSVIDYDTGFVMGRDVVQYMEFTPEYAAPERLQLDAAKISEDPKEIEAAMKRFTPASDAFAVACVLLFIMTGKLFNVQNDDGSTEDPGFALIDRIPLQVPRIAPMWRSLLRGMLCADPDQRITPGTALYTFAAAQREGLVQRLNDPFSLLTDYEWYLDELPALNGSVRLARCRSNGARCLVQHLEDVWQLNTAAQDRSTVKETANSRRQRLLQLNELAERLNALGLAGIPGFRIEQHEGLCFAVMEIPEGTLYPLARVRQHLNLNRVDGLMADLLDDVQQCHNAGLLLGCLDQSSFAAVDTGKGFRLVMTAPWTMLRCDALPGQAAFDTTSILLPPELGYYITADSRQEFEELKGFIGPASDVFSLGLLYHLLITGKLPDKQGYANYSMAASDQAITLLPALANKRSELVERMIACEPGDRTSQCSEIAARIRAQMSAQGVAGKAPANVPAQDAADQPGRTGKRPPKKPAAHTGTDPDEIAALQDLLDFVQGSVVLGPQSDEEALMDPEPPRNEPPEQEPPEQEPPEEEPEELYDFSVLLDAEDQLGLDEPDDDDEDAPDDEDGAGSDDNGKQSLQDLIDFLTNVNSFN